MLLMLVIGHLHTGGISYIATIIVMSDDKVYNPNAWSNLVLM